MSGEPDSALVDYVFGRLSEAERAQFEALLANDAGLRDELADLETAVAAMGEVPFRANDMLTHLTQRLEGPERFAHFTREVATVFDITPAQAQTLLAEVAADEGFEEGLSPGVQLKMVKAGPRCEGAMTAIVKVQPSATFPAHKHGDEETVLVLEGAYRDDGTGAEVWRGEYDRRSKGTEHSFTALEGQVCLCAAVTYPWTGED